MSLQWIEEFHIAKHMMLLNGRFFLCFVQEYLVIYLNELFDFIIFIKYLVKTKNEFFLQRKIK